MSSNMWGRGIACPMLALCVSSLAGAADDDGGAKVTLGLGAGFAPQYEGANEYRPIPFFVAQARWGARFFIGTEGNGLRADIVGWRFIEAGPAVTIRFKRDANVDDPVIAMLPKVDQSIEVGGFLALNFPMPLTGNEQDGMTLEASYMQDVAGGHDGHTIQVSMRYRGRVTESLVLQIGPFATRGSESFMSAYYDVSPTSAAMTGLAPFDAHAGWKDVGARADVRYSFTDHWNINGNLQYRHFLGDATDSPVISERGSPGNWFGGFALGYTF